LWLKLLEQCPVWTSNDKRFSVCWPLLWGANFLGAIGMLLVISALIIEKGSEDSGL